MSKDRARRDEILNTAATLLGSSGLRTTLKDIADACGILPGSLYHHFESKDAILIELVKGYQADLGEISEAALERLARPDAPSVPEMIVEFGEEIAACAVRHRAALLLTLYEPPATSSEELTRLAARTPTAIHTAMLETMRVGQSGDYLRAEVDLVLLADRLCQSMLHIGIGVSHRMPGAHRMPALRCRVLLEGVAGGPLDDETLDHSDAFSAANSVIAGWDKDPELAEDPRTAVIHAAARAEFARRGYDTTTMRDIAAAAGVNIRGVYRVTESKEQLLAAIMQSYATNVVAGWNAIFRSTSTAAEKIDALMWFDINIMDRFSQECRIQFSGIRHAPPTSPDLTWTFPSQLRQVRALLTDGTRAGDVRFEGAAADLRARCLFELLFTPENIIRAAGPRAALELSRETVLRGAGTHAPSVTRPADPVPGGVHHPPDRVS